jgi:hypothetical protein
MKRIAFVLALIFSAGCAAEGHLNTPSGRPEITVNVRRSVAEKECLRFLLANGFTVGNDRAVALSGNRLQDNGNPNIRITFNYYVVDNTTTTIYVTKTNWYKHSREHPQTTQADYEELQNDLNAIAQNLASP